MLGEFTIEFVGVMVTYVNDLMVAARLVMQFLVSTIAPFWRTTCAGLMVNQIHVTLPEKWKQRIVKLIQFLGVTTAISREKFYMHPRDWIRAQILERKLATLRWVIESRHVPRKGKQWWRTRMNISAGSPAHVELLGTSCRT